jgi:ATP-dependent protease ClpP protease subunit
MSSAVLLACACDNVLIDRQAAMAAHPALAAVVGNSLAMRKAAAELDESTAATMQAVMAKTGKTAEEIQPWFDCEKDFYFTAEEAVKVGLADDFFELP